MAKKPERMDDDPEHAAEMAEGMIDISARWDALRTEHGRRSREGQLKSAKWHAYLARVGASHG